MSVGIAHEGNICLHGKALVTGKNGASVSREEIGATKNSAQGTKCGYLSRVRYCIKEKHGHLPL